MWFRNPNFPKKTLLVSFSFPSVLRVFCFPRPPSEVGAICPQAPDPRLPIFSSALRRKAPKSDMVLGVKNKDRQWGGWGGGVGKVGFFWFIGLQDLQDLGGLGQQRLPTDAESLRNGLRAASMCRVQVHARSTDGCMWQSEPSWHSLNPKPNS